MAYAKIDNQDLTLQVESASTDVWVPDALAIPKRDRDYKEYSFFPLNTTSATSLAPSDVEAVYDATNGWGYSFGTKNAKQPTLYSFLTYISGTSSPRADIDRQYSRNVGPIICQNKIPIAVESGDSIKMAGSFVVKQTAVVQKDMTEKSDTRGTEENGIPYGLLVAFELWGVSYYQDEYGNDQEVKIKLQSFIQNLQGNTVTANFVTYNIPAMDYSVVPEGCTAAFLTVSFVSTQGNYVSAEYNSSGVKYGWLFFGGTIPPASIYCRLPNANPLKIIVKQSDTAHVVTPNSLSSTGYAFKNRGFFENVFPLFNYLNISNSSFENDAVGWTGLKNGDGISSGIFKSGTKSLRVVADSTIHDIAPATIDVVPGENYYAEVWVRSDGTYSDVGQIGLAATMSTDGSSPSYPSFVLKNASEVGTAWILISGRISVPAGANKMTVRLTVRNSVTGGTYYFDDLKVARLTHDNEMKIMGTTTTGTEVNVYEWNGQRQSLVANIVCAANEKKTVDISSTTGMIEVAKPGQVTPGNMAIVKMGTQNQITRNVWVPITGFRTSSSYPGTVLEGNGLRVQNSGLVSFRGYITFSGVANTFLKGMRVLVNGVTSDALTFTTSEKTTGMSGQTAPMQVTAGDLITFEAFSNSNFTERTITGNTHYEMIYTPVVTSGNDFFIESVLAKKYEALDQIQNNIQLMNFSDVTDEMTTIAIERNEADAGTATIKFASSLLDPRTNVLLQIGKTVRVLGRHYGDTAEAKPEGWNTPSDYVVVYTGKVKRLEVVYNYFNEPQIVLTCHDSFNKLDSIKFGMAYSKISEYQLQLSQTGSETVLNGLDITGPAKQLDESSRFFPATYSDNLTLMDAIIVTRNTQKSFIWVDRKNIIRFSPTISSSIKMTLTDGTMPGDMSMGNIKLGIDTDSIVNAIDIEENLLDRKDLVERQAKESIPPELFEHPKGLKKKIRYQDDQSIRSFGEFAKTFQVIRGTGSYDDLKADNFGDSYEGWSTSILTTYGVPSINISELKIPIKTSWQIKKVGELELLDKIKVNYLGESYIVTIRSISHDIQAGKWIVTLKFIPKADMTYWS